MFAEILTTLLEIVQNEQSATGKHVESAKGEKCNTNTLQRVKVQHKIE